jgi:hypothetical protein
VATLLLAEFGSSSAIAVYVIVAALVCGVVIALAPAAWTPVESDLDVNPAGSPEVGAQVP